MLKVKGTGKVSNSVVDLLDWCELPDELILILERPVQCMDLFDYIQTKDDIMYESKAKVGLLTFYEHLCLGIEKLLCLVVLSKAWKYS